MQENRCNDKNDDIIEQPAGIVQDDTDFVHLPALCHDVWTNNVWPLSFSSLFRVFAWKISKNSHWQSSGVQSGWEDFNITLA